MAKDQEETTFTTGVLDQVWIVMNDAAVTCFQTP